MSPLRGSDMRKVIVTMWYTLDGYIAGDGGMMDFVGEYFDEDMGAYESMIADSTDTLILGRVTYDSFASSWPNVPNNPDVSDQERDYATKINAMKKVVFSKTLKNPTWGDVVVLDKIEPHAINELKEMPGKDMYIYGSASVVQQMTNMGLIDEYQILLYPTILGGGKHLFDDVRRTKLALIEARTFRSGVQLLRYKPA